jgi:hypothetical protein
VVERRRHVIVTAPLEGEHPIDRRVVGAAEEDDRRLGGQPLDLGRGARDHDIGARTGDCDLEAVVTQGADERRARLGSRGQQHGRRHPADGTRRTGACLDVHCAGTVTVRPQPAVSD